MCILVRRFFCSWVTEDVGTRGQKTEVLDKKNKQGLLSDEREKKTMEEGKNKSKLAKTRSWQSLTELLDEKDFLFSSTPLSSYKRWRDFKGDEVDRKRLGFHVFRRKREGNERRKRETRPFTRQHQSRTVGQEQRTRTRIDLIYFYGHGATICINNEVVSTLDRNKISCLIRSLRTSFFLSFFH